MARNNFDKHFTEHCIMLADDCRIFLVKSSSILVNRYGDGLCICGNTRSIVCMTFIRNEISINVSHVFVNQRSRHVSTTSLRIPSPSSLIRRTILTAISPHFSYSGNSIQKSRSILITRLRTEIPVSKGSSNAERIAFCRSERDNNCVARSIVLELSIFDKHFIARLLCVVFDVFDNDAVTCEIDMSNNLELVEK
ncbi:hypothetical protein DERF_006235 [Dermatophagoides farinae]|uniref:Uncharacterized protein n=1 Tax=Dermatophagoides farinae TaxID=6954 RepID=A0A922L7H2_DERFA|nr:hypothetical protein DERF_006235 [Dermatophagoides farinae]